MGFTEIFDQYGIDAKKLNSAIYYVNNKKDLINCINKITKSDKISFKEYPFEGKVKLNVK